MDAALARRPFSTIIDLGCGNGKSLARIVSSNPGSRGYGIDVSREACDLAVKTAEQQGCGDRVRIIHGDAIDVARLADLSFESRNKVTDQLTENPETLSGFFVLRQYPQGFTESRRPTAPLSKTR